jgi:DNA-binding NtrC family response regulator
MAYLNFMVVSRVPEVHQVFATALAQRGVAPIIASTLSEAQTILRRHCIHLVFCSDELPDCGVGALLLQTSRPPGRVPVVVFSRLNNGERYLSFLEAGAFDYVLYPPSGVEIDLILERVLGLGTSAITLGAPQFVPRSNLFTKGAIAPWKT